MKIKAKFTGVSDKNYLNGSIYLLEFGLTQSYYRNELKKIITISKMASLSLEGIAYVEYQSLRKFLDNWEVL